MPRFSDLDAELVLGPWTAGIVDTPYDEEVPRGAVSHALGFHWRRGYPYTESGRDSFTGAEVVTSKRNEAMIRYSKPDGSTYLVTVCDGGLWAETTAGSGTCDNLISVFDPGATVSAVAGGTAVSVTGLPSGRTDLTKSVRAGDYFYLDADGSGSAVEISSASGTTMALGSAYGGGTNGEYTIWRKLAADVDLALGNQGIFITDGSGPMHFYGETYRESGVYEFREVGLPKPDAPGSYIDQPDGNLLGAAYQFGIAFEDAAGRVGPVEKGSPLTVLAGQRMMVTDLPNAPIWAKKYVVFRTQGGLFNLYRIWHDVRRGLSAISGSGPTTLTLDTRAHELESKQHKQRTVKFDATGNEYRITNNSGTTITVAGDASGEGTTDYVEIAGGVDIENSSTCTDYASDEDATYPDQGIDFWKPAPSEKADGTSHNAAPPVGLSGVTIFKGGGHWIAHDGEARTWVSGRPLLADVWLNEFAAKGQFHYCSIFHDIGGGDNKAVVKLWRQHDVPYAGREDGFFRLDRVEQDDIAAWEWRQTSDKAGLLAKDSLDIFDNTAWCLGTFAGKTDILRFDGYEAQSLGQRHIGRTLDAILQITKCTGVVFDGMYWLSYTTSGTGGQIRTLRYYIEQRLFDKQGWGCGIFLEGYRSSDSHYLLCAAPDAANGDQSGHIYRANGQTNDDLGNPITRELYSRNASLEVMPQPVNWHLVHADVRVGL